MSMMPLLKLATGHVYVNGIRTQSWLWSTSAQDLIGDFVNRQCRDKGFAGRSVHCGLHVRFRMQFHRQPSAQKKAILDPNATSGSFLRQSGHSQTVEQPVHIFLLAVG